MKPSQVAEAIRVGINRNRAMFIWGPPGAGKSSVVNQVAAEEGRKVIDVRLSQLESVDLRGIPQIREHDQETRVHWVTPEFLPASDGSDGPTLLFLDEMNGGLPSTQAAAYQLVLDRKLGSYSVPDNCAIIAAGNREDDRGVTYTMPAPLANRFVHLDYDVDFEDWRKWALTSGIRTEVISYINFRPGNLMKFDPDAKAFPTPRSWQFVSDTLSEEGTVSNTVEHAIIEGAVGKGISAEFVGFLKIHRNLPNPDYVLMNPDKADVPTDPATLYALCGALSERVNETNFDRFGKYLNRMRAEFQVLAMRDAVIRKPELVSQNTFTNWAAQNADYVM
jgi:hypothetical protein